MEAFLTDASNDFEKIYSNTLIPEKELDSLIINNKENLLINAQKLIESESKVIFLNCKNITFDKDITKDQFRKYINKIHLCKGIKIPSSIPELIRLSVLENSNDVEIY